MRLVDLADVEHVLGAAIRIVAVELAGLDETHERGGTLTGA